MAKYNAHIERFNIGEYSNAALNRVDLSTTRLAAEIQENIFPHKVGKGQVRPGTTYLGRTRNDKRARLQAFARSPSDKALLELTDGYLRVWYNDALVTRPAVTASINGTFGLDYGFTIFGAYIGNENVEGGSRSVIETKNPGVEHALRIQVTRGPILFKLGTQPGKEDVIAESALDEGWHSLAFTPSGTTYFTFTNRLPRDVVVASMTIESSGPMEIPAPWAESDLDYFQFEQSADTIFCANRGLRPLMIQRRGNTSWSVVYYIPQDGPWLETPPGSGEVSLRPNSDDFNGSATASTDILNASTMDNVLVRVFNDRLDRTVTLGGNNTYTDPFRITGIIGETTNDRKYRYVINAQGKATLRWQRSITGEGGDFGPASRSSDNTTSFKTLAKFETWSADVTHNGFDEDDNLVAWHRIGYGPGDYDTTQFSPPYATIRIIYDGNGSYGVGIIRDVTSTTVAEVDWFDLPNAPDPSFIWSLGAWGAHAEYPSSVGIFDNRLWWGGRSRVWGSTLGDFFSFNDLDTTELATITRLLGTGGTTNQSNFILPLQRLIIGTSGSELSLRSSAIGDVLTALNATVRTGSSYGSSIVQPVKIDSRGVYIHRDGISSMLLDFVGEDYRSAKLTEYNDGILEPSCTQLAVQRQPETYVWHVRSDGEAAMLLLDADDTEDRLMSWTRFTTAGEVESMAVLPDDDQDAVYMSVKRTPRAVAQDAAYETETNADLLMGNDSAGWAMDFTDGSFTVRWPDEPTHQDRISGKTIVVDGRRGTNTREDGTFSALKVEDYGIVPGPDEYNMAWFNFLGHWSQPVYLRQADGTLKLQQHNYLNRTEQVEAPKTGYPGPYTLYDVLNTNYGLFYENVDINSDQDTFLSCDGENNVTISPRGDMTGGRLFSDTRTGIDGQHYISLGFQINSEVYDSYAYSAPAGWFSFSAKPAELSVMEVAFNSYNASFPSFIVHHPEDVGTGSSQSGSCITYRIDLATGTVTKVFEQHAFTTQDLYIYEVDVEEQPNGWYRYHFKYSEHEDSAWHIRILDENLNRSFVADGKGFYLWGLQDKLDGTDDHRTYLKQYDNFFAFPSSGSQRQQLLPYEWDEDGNCLGVRYYDWDIDFVSYWNNDFAHHGAVGYFGEGTPVDGDTTGYTGRIDHGTSYTNSSKLGPDATTLAGIWTDDGGGYTTTTGSTGIDIPRTYYEDAHSGQDCASIFAKYDGSCRYITISHWNGFPSEETWYSVTWDVVTGEVTEEYYEPGNATGTAIITNRHTKAGEWYADGWFRFMSSCRFEYQGTSNARVYWAMSTIPNPGATNRGVQAATTSGTSIQVWYPMLHANHGYQQAVAGPPRPFKLDKSYSESPGAVIPIGKDAGYYQYHGDRTDKEVLPINYDCWRFEQTVVPIDGWFDPEHFNTYLAETRPYYDYFGWPSVYSGYDESELGFDFDAETVTNSFFGTLWQMSDDPKFDFVGYYKYAGLLGSPNEELAGFVTGAYETWYPPTKFTSFPPEGAAPIPALAFELNKEYTSVINLIENFGVEMYMNGVYIGAEETLAPNFVETVNNIWQSNGSSLFYTGESDSSFAFDGYAHGHRQFYLKQLKVTSQCGPDEPRFIERLNKHDEALGGVINKMADAGNYFAGPVSSVTVEQHAGFGGLVAWGTRVSDGFTGPIPGPLGATSSGRVDLGDTYTDVFIGLPYTARYKSAKLAYAGEGGTALEQPKKVTEFGLLLNDTHIDAVKYGEDFDRMRSMPRIYKGKPVADGTVWSEYDDVSFSMPGSWNTDSRLCLKVVAPYPATFTGLVISVETNARGGKS